MIVRDCMTTQVVTVRPDDEVGTVREVFRRRRIRQLPVVVAERVSGMVTDRDVRGRDERALVETVMSSPAATTSPETTIEAAASILRIRKFGALPVLEGERLVGIVSESDILWALVDLCALLEPTTVLEIQSDGDDRGAQRIRHLLERHGGRVAWLTDVGSHGGSHRISLRVRMPLGHSPERLLEEAGFQVLSCVIEGRSTTQAKPGSAGAAGR
jgi:acetoin utilization protein AcuB